MKGRRVFMSSLRWNISRNERKETEALAYQTAQLHSLSMKVLKATKRSIKLRSEMVLCEGLVIFSQPETLE